MRAFQYVKSAIGQGKESESRLSKEFEGKSGSEIVDRVSEEVNLNE